MTGMDKPYQKVVVEDPSVGEPEVRLWRSVLMQAITDALIEDERQGLMEWVLTQDFETTVQLAGLHEDKWGKMYVKILLSKKPQSIILANELKRLTYYGSLSVC
jgi:hypothetical protein